VQQLERNPPESFVQEVPRESAQALLSRVVSIRAQATADEGDAPANRGGHDADSDDDFMPLGAEHRALGRMANALREIIEGARTQSLSLQSTVEQASALDDDIAAASRQLHERLSLSARMLKAFQSQIDRIEGLLEGARAGEERVAALNERMGQRISEFETRLERYLERFEARLDEMVARASKRFKAQIAEHEQAMKAASEALPNLDRRLGSLHEQLVATESNMAAADASLRDTIEDATEAQSELKADAERAMEIASHLKDQWHVSAQQLEGGLRAATEAAHDLEARSARAHTLLPALRDLEQIRVRLSNLLSQLEPVLPILQNEERFAAARVRRAAELMRDGLRRELVEIAGAFQRLAEQGVPSHKVADEPVPRGGATPPHPPRPTRPQPPLVEVMMLSQPAAGAD